MNLKSIVLFAAILFIAGISFGIPMFFSGGRIRDTHASDLLLAKITPTATLSTAQVQTKQAFAQMFFSPTASFTITASLQPSQTANPTVTAEDTATPSATSTLTVTPSATHPFVTFTSKPDRKTTPVPPTSTPQPRPTSIPPTKVPTTQVPPTAEPPTATEPPATQVPTDPPQPTTEPSTKPPKPTKEPTATPAPVATTVP